MNLSEIGEIRLRNQQLTGTGFTTAKEIVGWMGAMQAQDYAMAKWAIGTRLPNSTDKTIQAAIDNGEIIRTHLMRPTWHIVSRDNAYWMLELTAQRLINAMRSHYKRFELDAAIFNKSNAIIEKSLSGGNHLTRDELINRLKIENINTSDLRSVHLLLRAELDRVICSGVSKDKNQTYALLQERVPIIKLSRDEALAKLATRYFESHGPATLADFSWWSGLSITEAKRGFEMVKDKFACVNVGDLIFWMSNDLPDIRINKKSDYLLPAFDEFLISYADRTAAIGVELQNIAFTKNGIFKPVIISNGQVTGTWARSIKKDKVIIETSFFKQPTETSKKLILKQARLFGRFLAKEVEVK